MLKPEEAQRRMKQWLIDEDKIGGQAAVGEATRFAAAIRQLPKSLAHVAFGLFGLEANGQAAASSASSWHRMFIANQKAAGLAFDALKTADRLKILRIMFPKMAPEINRAWCDLQRAPYDFGYGTKAYRAPESPEFSAAMRQHWLKRMLELAERVDGNILEPVWLANWAPYIRSGYDNRESEIGKLLASVVDAGNAVGDEVFEILCQSARNEHEIGCMGRHVINGLLMSAREEGWQLMEKLLLAAQRQEGLRQSILESVDVAHPQAFCRILQVMQEHDLVRFSAVARAVDLWFGFAWDSASVKTINGIIGQALQMLENHAERAKALAGDDPHAIYMALWAAGFENAPASIALARPLLKHSSSEVRFVAVVHLQHLKLDEATTLALTASDDDNLRVAWQAIESVPRYEYQEASNSAESTDRFERLERLISRLPAKPQTLAELVWPWTKVEVSREPVTAGMMVTLENRPATRLLPYVSMMDSMRRRQFAGLIADSSPADASARAALLDLAKDVSIDVRPAAFKALEKTTLTPDELAGLVATLNRKAADLRVSVIGLVMATPDDAALATAQRLLSAKDAQQRLAGLELLRQLQAAGRGMEQVQHHAEAFAAARPKRSQEEERQLQAILAPVSESSKLSLNNALGLMDPARRTPVVAPRSANATLITPAAIACLQELDALVDKHRETPIALNDRSKETELLGTIRWGFPSPVAGESLAKAARRLPLFDVWEKWFTTRSKKTRDADGLEILRAERWFDYGNGGKKRWQAWSQQKPHRAAMLAPLDAVDPVPLKYDRMVDNLLQWLLFLHPPVNGNSFLLDAVETLTAAIPAEELQTLVPSSSDNSKSTARNPLHIPNPWYGNDWRSSQLLTVWYPSDVSKLIASEVQRYWQLDHWLDCPLPGATRERPHAEVLFRAYRAGHANLHDIADDLLGPRDADRGVPSFQLLSNFTARRPTALYQSLLTDHPEVAQLVEQARQVILETELTRGEAPTAATAAAHSLGSLNGGHTLIRLLRALGKNGLKPVSGWRDEVKLQLPQTLTYLTRITYPSADDTPEQFAKLIKAEIKAKSFPEERLMELAFLAPQWTRFVEHYFNWNGMSEAVYWFLAHMDFMWGSSVGEQAAEAAGMTEEEPAVVASSDGDEVEISAETNDDADAAEPHAVPPKKLTPWQRLIRERTALSDLERNDGAIDVIWFERVHAQLGPKRWQQLAQAAKFASNSAQAKKAQLIADVLLGKAKLPDLIAGIEKKYLKENVRLIGLYPLPKGAKREPELARRFNILQEYNRYAKKLSGLTKPAALRALEIGLKNLASTAGYADALRLDWALGVSQWSDLRKGPVAASKDGVTVTLTLTEDALPQISVARENKILKSPPAAVKKDPAVAELFERAREIKRQGSRQKRALEAAMCRGDQFTASELIQLSQHALVAPFLERLVLVGEGILGYPDKGGKALRTHAGKLEPIKKNELLRIAHPHDLYLTKDWSCWQRECFQSERVQPFKQVFRELYLINKQEQTTGNHSQRFAGQQVNPSQALALWGSRGWDTGEGVFKVFYHAEMLAGVTFNHGTFTPLEVEGLTLESVYFSKRGDAGAIKLADVPPHLFSEVMRDMDLVVSVAHRGGVDPEASASTVEMRANLVRETAQLMGLKNVRLKASHVLVDGELANYTIHLGSGTVQRMPGGALCVVPVHAQHRGRIFLPFADDDPRSAEILSKVLLFARDQEIQDPGILEQLRV